MKGSLYTYVETHHIVILNYLYLIIFKTPPPHPPLLFDLIRLCL